MVWALQGFAAELQGCGLAVQPVRINSTSSIIRQAAVLLCFGSLGQIYGFVQGGPPMAAGSSDVFSCMSGPSEVVEQDMSSLI